MTEGVQAPEDPAAARAAEQARLRKARREAKIKAGGASRLDKITGLGGGIQRDAPPSVPQPTAAVSSPPSQDAHADPEEVDISQHYYEPQTTARPSPGDGLNMSEAQLRQIMLGLDRPSPAGTPPARNPFGDAPPPPMPGMEGMEEDPMMQMLSKMMAGGMPGGMGGAGGANPFAGTPMEGLFGGGVSPMQQAQNAAANKTTNLWRIFHAIFAIGLGLFLALSTTFTGTKAERESEAMQSTGLFGEHDIEQTRQYFFYVFTSVEAALLTSRYFLDKDRAPPSGWMWTISGFLPIQIQGYVRHALRYSEIFSTVRNDALVCVFVLGVCCMLRT
ncbi:hypothetical protein F5Y15DRAFT_403344 [Xylariaceae sp. FL0016]|nr:hypothetical protein F5Y15DRAFT_403344 [Xylariaceae sp. FL0016]